MEYASFGNLLFVSLMLDNNFNINQMRDSVITVLWLFME